MTLKNTKPYEVFENFVRISKIPRCSKHEQQISDFLVQWAKERSLEVIQDKHLNVIIKKPGSKGRVHEKPIILQGHMDMVCEKRPTSIHDFKKDPISLQMTDDWIHTVSTTLGADNGIAIAMIMAILESKDLRHPPIEAMFTADEEQGMSGAIGIDSSLFTGNRLINIDSEEEGKVCVSCAGGERNVVSFKKEWMKRRFPKTYELKITECKGGHSGVDIDKGLGNANKLLGRALYEFQKHFTFDLLHIKGGAQSNAIPRDATAYIGIKEEDLKQMQRTVILLGGEFSKEFAYSDPKVKLSFEEMVDISNESNCFSENLTRSIILYLLLVPNGILSYSQKMKGLVESSTNIGVIKELEQTISFTSAIRSSLESHIDYIHDLHKELALKLGGSFESNGRYPTWEFKDKSPLRDTAILVYEKLYGEKLELQSIHAGLECAIFDQKFHQLDMISIGPTITGAHSPDERLSISSTKKVYDFLIKLLENC